MEQFEHHDRDHQPPGAHPAPQRGNTEDDDQGRGGQPLSVGTAFVRSLMKLISGAVLLIGYLWMLWDPEKQTWHDKVAGTYVVNSN